MSQLGHILELSEGSRLTGVSLHPLDEFDLLNANTLHLQIIRLEGRSDPSAFAGALSTFVPQLFATIHGDTPYGDGWIGLLLLSMDLGPDHPFILGDLAALAPLRRALDLTGIRPRSVRNVPMTDDRLRGLYASGAAEVNVLWGISDLVLGLLVELTGTPLGDVVDLAQGSDSSDDQVRAPDRGRLEARLMEWAATYEGPEL